MNIEIHTIHFDADEKLLDFVRQKVNKLGKFNDDIMNAEVFLRFENAPEMENKMAEIKLTLRGSNLFAKKQGKNFEEAVDLAAEAMRKQLKKHKEKPRRA